VRELIFSHFENSETIAIFLATLGGGYEKFREALGSSLLDAYMFDYLASEYIEKLCDHFYEMLSASVKQFNWGMTNRYSPGYCGWDVLEQKQLFNLLPPEFCGVTVNSFGLMSPLKSISGIIGLGAGCKREDYDCLFCSIDECLRRIE
jgi:cobalamin-dependent methionine synthase I